MSDKQRNKIAFLGMPKCGKSALKDQIISLVNNKKVTVSHSFTCYELDCDELAARNTYQYIGEKGYDKALFLFGLSKYLEDKDYKSDVLKRLYVIVKSIDNYKSKTRLVVLPTTNNIVEGDIHILSRDVFFECVNECVIPRQTEWYSVNTDNEVRIKDLIGFIGF